ncbi:MAG: sugar transferase [Terriglobia bacterium]
MSNAQTRFLPRFLKVSDSLLMVMAFGLASLSVLSESKDLPWAEFFSIRIKVQNFILFFLILTAWRIIFSTFGLYNLQRLSARREQLLEVAQATSLCTLFAGLASIVANIRLVDPLFMVTFWAASFLFIASSRLLTVYVLTRRSQAGRHVRNVLMVGTNQRSVEFARKLESKPGLGYRIIGFADGPWPGLEGFHQTGYKVVCDFDTTAEFLRKHVVDDVIIGLPFRSHYYTAARIVSLCEVQGIVVHFLPLLVEPKVARYVADDFDGNPLVTLYSGPGDASLLMVKRALDFTLSLISLILLSPVFLVVAALIKLTSPGPVFFIQERLGLNKRLFRLCKFRTMVPDAEARQAELEKLNEMNGPVFKISSDPRITPIGRFLRKTSLDELPQLLNVLKGEMSLVGPRPLPVRDYEGFDQDWHRRRFSVRPGITCFWQMSGRNSIPFEKWMELDMQYIDRWSLWLDLEIILGTIPAVLKGSGAA